MDQQQIKEQSLAGIIKAMKGGELREAERLCRHFLNTSPGCVDHLRMLSHSLIKQNKLPGAEVEIRKAINLLPNFPPLLEDLGGVLAASGHLNDAIDYFEKAIRMDPNRPTAHKKLGQALAAAGRVDEADEAFEIYFEKDPSRGKVAIGADHMKSGRLDEAVDALKSVLKSEPDNVDALRFLAATYKLQDKRLADAEALLRRALEIAPDFLQASVDLGTLLISRNKHVDGIGVFEDAIKRHPDSAVAWAGLGSANSMGGYPEKAVEAYKKSIELNPGIPATHMSAAHALKTVGDQEGSLKAYRRAVEMRPELGEVYWSMANLKIFNFEEKEVRAMEEQLESGKLTDSADVHIRFALGKAYEDKKDYDRAWYYYNGGNERQREKVEYRSQLRHRESEEMKSVFSKEFILENEGNGYDAPDPIFIVGLPRSGSTLVEQILASHSMVEGTSELPDLSRIAHTIGQFRSDGIHFPAAAADVASRDWKPLGREYIEKTKRHRVTDRPIFTDKMPNNFPLVGYIHLTLPNARIINARRHPLDSCLGSYKQLFGQGQNFTYDIVELGEYYSQYDSLMRHWNDVLPGKVLDVDYEVTVTDLEGQVRRILDHCGLPFEEQCLRFHETERAVQTASSEQVRQPIYRGGLGKWRDYDTHLADWKDMLKHVIDDRPDVVQNAGLR